MGEEQQHSCFDCKVEEKRETQDKWGSLNSKRGYHGSMQAGQPAAEEGESERRPPK